MANEAKLRETLDVIGKNLLRWNQDDWAQGETNPEAADYTECKTVFCFAGWRCVLDGLRPRFEVDFNDLGERVTKATGAFYDPTHEIFGSISAANHAQESLALTDWERANLFTFYSGASSLEARFAELTQRVEDIIAGKYRSEPDE